MWVKGNSVLDVIYVMQEDSWDACHQGNLMEPHYTRQEWCEQLMIYIWSIEIAVTNAGVEKYGCLELNRLDRQFWRTRSMISIGQMPSKLNESRANQ